MNVRRADREDGMALITVLMLVAVMGALTAVTLEIMSRSVALTGNSRASSQAHHYAAGAGLVAARQFEAIREASGEVLTNDTGWIGEPIMVPTEGGSITMRFDDASHCFNVNSVVAGEIGSAATIRPIAVQQFVSLAGSVGIGRSEAQRMALALVDFLDSDAFPQGGGAEDGAYQGYRTAGTLFASASEVMAVRGWTHDRYLALQDFLCALPTTDMQAMNVNTMDAGDAPLLAMLMPDSLPLARARQLIASRPVGGWDSRQDFWSSPALAGRPPTAQAQYAVDVTSNLVRVDIEVEEAGLTVSETQLMGVSRERATVLQRRWGPGA